MAQSTRARLVRVPRQEKEVHLISNPMESVRTPPVLRERLTDADYEAPLTADSLRPNSPWLIVRQNLHRIRSMGYTESNRQGAMPDLYLGLQMTRELRRAQLSIQNADQEDDFHIIKHFELAVGKARTKKFDTSHVKPEDALIYDRLGEEPLSLQNLLYYFSKQDVQKGSVFWDFLSGVNQVLDLQRKRTVLVQRLRRIALILAVIIYVFIGLMLSAMIISVITTVTRMNDPEVQWTEQIVEIYPTSSSRLQR
jgi:hypothetical protein